MTDVTPSPKPRDRPAPPVRPSRPALLTPATGTAGNPSQSVKTPPVAPERQFPTRREMRLAQRAVQDPLETVSEVQVTRKPEPAVEVRKPVPNVEVHKPEVDLSYENEKGGLFWKDLSDDLESPEFAGVYRDASAYVREVDDEVEAEVLEAERLEDELVLEATGMEPVSFSSEELRLRRRAREFVGIVSNDEVISTLVLESDAETIDEHLRSLLTSRLQGG